MNGKGDKRRPSNVPFKVFDDNWERAFKKKEKEEKKSG